MKIDNRKSIGILMMTMLIGSLLSSCKKDNNDVTKPADINESELITTVQFKISSTDSPFVTHTFQYRDVDGIGGNAPVIDTIKLSNNKVYYVEVLFLDESKNPIDTISNEVKAESKDHLLVFEPSDTSLTVTINDFDTNNPSLPLGLISSWSTSSVNQLNLKLSLKHQPGIKNGDPTKGETDVEVILPLIIE